MRSLLVFGLTLLTVFSCRKEKDRDEILSQQEMVKALQELYISEEQVGRLGLKMDSARKVSARLEEKIFDKLGVQDSVFRRSFDYYQKHPDQWEQIYAVLVDSLNLREQRLSRTQEAE